LEAELRHRLRRLGIEHQIVDHTLVSGGAVKIGGDPSILPNAGMYRPIHVVADPGTITAYRSAGGAGIRHRRTNVRPSAADGTR